MVVRLLRLTKGAGWPVGLRVERAANVSVVAIIVVTVIILL